MSHPLSQGTTFAIHLTCPTNSGGKEWVGAQKTPTIIETFWGPFGRISQQAEKTGTPHLLDKLITEKLAKGYNEVDRFENGQWRNQQTPHRAEGPPPKAPSVPLVSIIDETKKPEDGIGWDF